MLARLREGYPLDIPDSLRDIPFSTQIASFFFCFCTDIPVGISPGQ